METIMVRESAVYTHNELDGIKRPELSRIAKLLKVNDLSGKNEAIIERIVMATKTNRCTINENGDIVAPNKVETREKIHPTAGEYGKYIITARDETVTREAFQNNSYKMTIKMGEEVRIPVSFADFIANSCYSVKSKWDKSKIDPETGELGIVTKQRLPDFFLQKVG